MKVHLNITLDCPGSIEMYEDLLIALKKVKKDIKKLDKNDKFYYNYSCNSGGYDINNKDIQLKYELFEELED